MKRSRRCWSLRQTPEDQSTADECPCEICKCENLMLKMKVLKMKTSVVLLLSNIYWPRKSIFLKKLIYDGKLLVNLHLPLWIDYIIKLIHILFSYWENTTVKSEYSLKILIMIHYSTSVSSPVSL